MSPLLITLAAAAALVILERLRPSVVLPSVPGWALRSLGLNLVQVLVVYAGTWAWDRWAPHFRLFDGGALPAAAGVALGYVTITFVFYWWHRARHDSQLLWQYMHQVHHSPVRMECAMSFYKHPMEMAINSLMSSTVLYVLVGLPPSSAAIVVAITGVTELLYHSNLRSPWWLGYFFQRPEMHRRHHERDWHRSNYSDLPVWDLLFGTFENPREIPAECGFADGAEQDLGQLLCGREPVAPDR